MKARLVKFYQPIEFGKNRAITFLNIDSCGRILGQQHFVNLEISVLDHGVKLSAEDQEDVVVPFNNVAYYQILQTNKVQKTSK